MQLELSQLNAINLLISGSFGIDMNANDLFERSCAMSVFIHSADVLWVVDHITKWGQDGLWSAMAFIQNQQPLPEYLTPGFAAAITDLMTRSPKVTGDVDHSFHGYFKDGPYRAIDPMWLPQEPKPDPAKGCPYDVCHKGPCGSGVPTGQTYCPQHSTVKCHTCGAQATGDCHGYSGSFVCGYPICPDHRHTH
jgi:hypothetical protein